MKRSPIAPLTLLTALLAALMLAATPAHAIGVNEGSQYFREQLDTDAKRIYDLLVDAYAEGRMVDGRGDIDLVGPDWQAAIAAYAQGNRQLFNDYAAAKDAFDLDHSEAWYVDSSYVSLRLVKDDQDVEHVLIGPGRKSTYYLDGVAGYPRPVAEMDAEVEAAIATIAAEAASADVEGLSERDANAQRVSLVHDAVTHAISYRFEPDCTPGNEPYVRTLYALVTHEGVCEGYARSMQVVLSRLGIRSVLVSGLQTSGDAPEQHMWLEVELAPDEWYLVDPTWDDPARADSEGNIVKDGENGVDGREHTRYLLVGSETTAEHWAPSGVVSGGNFSFSYPELESADYRGEEAFSRGGLTVDYKPSTMENALAGTFTISYQGEGMRAAGEKGYHLLIKMHDLHDDGTAHMMDEWYYAEATLSILEGGGDENPFFKDSDEALTLTTPTCEYLELALTTREPKGYQDWYDENGHVQLPTDGSYIDGYYHGDGSDILFETGRLYNRNSGYEAAPYVYTQYPTASGQVSPIAYQAYVIYDDALNLESDTGASLGAARPVEGDFDGHAAQAQDLTPVGVTVTYQCFQLDTKGELKEHTLTEYGQFDRDGNHVVDPENLVWLYNCDNDHVHDPRHCRLSGVSFSFDPSKAWADDTTLYSFQIEGVVGARSTKAPNNWEYVVSTPSCPIAYKSQGIDWNLWGRPSLLDNPDDLDLDEITMKGVDGREQSLADLQESMNLDDLNGRLMLVAEDLSGSREAVQELEQALADEGVSEQGMHSRSLFEIEFNRVCRMVMAKTGDSMRVQVGFPPGYNASSDVIFKAYHFTRNDKGAIVSVEEIPVAVTEYGLVVLCSSFSPFEMVAYDPSQLPADEAVQESGLVVATDGNATVTRDDGVDVTTGEESMKAMGAGRASSAFTVTPKPGYSLESVELDGVDRLGPVAEDGSYTLTVTADELAALADGARPADLSAILSVTTIASEVKQADAERHFDEVAVPMCPHLNVATEGGAKPVDATCTEAGSVPAETCLDCGQKIAEGATVAPLGHEWGADGTCVRCGVRDAEHDTTLPTKPVPVYRLYNPTSGEHLFTRDPNEVKILCDMYGWTSEEVAWQAPTETSVPVHRLLNPNTGEHLYTMDQNERDVLVAIGWEYEDVAWYSSGDDGEWVYRLSNPFIDGPGAHHYTTDPNEYRELGELGWKQENVCWYGLATE